MRFLNFYKYYPFILRKKFNKKYIVIESDDWGLKYAESMDSINFLKKKYGLERFTRWTTDDLETVEDISLLYELLFKFKTSFEYPPVITANFITHNIDYNNYNSLSFVPLSQTLKKNIDLSNKYVHGIKNNIFFPQLHGYCHYNLKLLQSFFNSVEGKELFNKGYLVGKSTLRGNLSDFRSEFKYEYSDINNIQDAVNEFYQVFKYSPISVIPPHFIIDRQILVRLKQLGIKSIQASNRLYNSSKRKYKKIFFRKSNGIYWMPRNARLDPHPDYNYNSDNCIADIKRAFDSHVPAVIDFHRVNISGNYSPKYRDRSLKELKIVLQTVLKEWPETQFISSVELFNLCSC